MSAPYTPHIIVEATIQHQAMEIMNLKQQLSQANSDSKTYAALIDALKIEMDELKPMVTKVVEDRDTWRQKAIELGLEASQAEALLAQYRAALEGIRPSCTCHHESECIDGGRYGKGVYEDEMNNAMGGKPWQHCHCIPAKVFEALAIPSPQAALNEYGQQQYDKGWEERAAKVPSEIADELDILAGCVCGECDTLLWNRAKKLREMK